MCVRVCADQAQWAKDLACELLRISTPLSRGRRGQVNTENGGECVKNTHIMHLRTRRHTLKRVRGGAPKLGEKKHVKRCTVGHC